MKIYIWRDATWVTDRYHPEAGVVIIAESLEQAREFAQEDVAKESDLYLRPPDIIRECEAPGVIIFPNAGCC